MFLREGMGAGGSVAVALPLRDRKRLLSLPGESLTYRQPSQSVPPDSAAAAGRTGHGRPAPSRLLPLQLPASTSTTRAASCIWRAETPPLPWQARRIEVDENVWAQAKVSDTGVGVQPLALQRWPCFIRSTDRHICGRCPSTCASNWCWAGHQRAEGDRQQFHLGYGDWRDDIEGGGILPPLRPSERISRRAWGWSTRWCRHGIQPETKPSGPLLLEW
jgi:hypothetical protein